MIQSIGQWRPSTFIVLQRQPRKLITLANQRLSICSTRITIELLRGIIFSDRPVIGKARYGENQNGLTGQAVIHRNGPHGIESKAGTVYEYNDVRVNVLALATLNIWRKPLPQVLKENIMDPIGASSTWRWIGYENSWVVLDGQLVQAVGGGGHWGGGMFISARDMARFGYLTLRRGKWKNTQLISDQWVTWALTPTAPQPTYGFMNWFLNTDKKYLPSAPATAFVHIGNGTNMIYVDPEHDLVVVARWIDNGSMDAFIQRVLEAINK